ncbi:hypothetical protein M434DRAFT_26551 [Hypoxylon sp. CO27-5]|nr:hypothetical protein M434DRAFT_26551 [Hypoxylon sp. CO27-5]
MQASTTAQFAAFAGVGAAYKALKDDTPAVQANPNGAAKVTRGYQSSPDAQACCSYDGDEAPALLAWAGTGPALNGTKNIDIGRIF